MLRKIFLSTVLMTTFLLLVGCRQTKTPPASSAAVTATPAVRVVKTVIGEGRFISGPLVIEGECARVNGQALAWKSTLKVQFADDSLRVLRTWNGQVTLFHAGDVVEVLGGCIYKGEGVESVCVTPSVEESLAETGCETGPYFVTDNIRRLETPAPPPSP